LTSGGTTVDCASPGFGTPGFGTILTFPDTEMFSARTAEAVERQRMAIIKRFFMRLTIASSRKKVFRKRSNLPHETLRIF
jgi:hypothetical protein